MHVLSRISVSQLYTSDAAEAVRDVFEAVHAAGVARGWFGAWVLEFEVHPPPRTLPLTSEYGTYKTVKARFWPLLSGTSPANLARCSRFRRSCPSLRSRRRLVWGSRLGFGIRDSRFEIWVRTTLQLHAWMKTSVVLGVSVWG